MCFISPRKKIFFFLFNFSNFFKTGPIKKTLSSGNFLEIFNIKFSLIMSLNEIKKIIFKILFFLYFLFNSKFLKILSLTPFGRNTFLGLFLFF